jgi:hypothetical protein
MKASEVETIRLDEFFPNDPWSSSTPIRASPEPIDLWK